MGTCPNCQRKMTPIKEGEIGWGVDEFICPHCDTTVGIAPTS